MFKNPSEVFGFLQLSHSDYLTDNKNIFKFQNVHHIAVLQQELSVCIRQNKSTILLHVMTLNYSIVILLVTNYAKYMYY